MLKKRDQGEMGEMGEEHFLALILKENTGKNECEKELGNYCKSLKDAELTSEKVHKNLKDVCKEEKANEEKCKELEKNIKDKCTEFKKKLEKAENSINSENCTEYEPQCHFLEGACINVLKEECSKLRNQCYGLKRDKVAKEVLLRALKGDLKEGNKKESKN
ncbi:hypothetical protein PCANB_002201 [Pneumocystis canis]|nr:hypothetical protein PCANB_002201 [Pneumocystis canis]